MDFEGKSWFRFIPASAGNTPRYGQSGFSPAVHPRERGEHGAALVRHVGQLGSSPRARGTRGGGVADGGDGRFIPASAGNTFDFAGEKHSQPVHPRERGEHEATRHTSSRVIGSSPRARGTLPLAPFELARLRFIPASAGNTCTQNTDPHGHAVHPRERGEHVLNTAQGAGVAGSSPRARGTRVVGQLGRSKRRFIPASAGNTTTARASETARAVHPRERGEHSLALTVTVSHTGSSPRARGTPGAGGPLPVLLRFIPASAGNTTAAPQYPQ